MVAVVAVVASVAGLGPAGAPVASAYLGDTVNLSGHGFGHGRGLGQYGSLGYALQGWDHRRILAHYYGGTTPGTRPDATIDVHLRIADAGNSRGTLDGQPMVVDSGQGFSVGANRFTAAEAARVTHTPAGWTIERGPGCGGPWTVAQAGISLAQQPTAVVDDPAVGNDVGRMIQLCLPSERRHYRGTLRAVSVAGESKVLNRVPMESYLRGVVPRESPASWADLGGGAGLQQLKAQSVAARSFAWAEDRGLAKTCDTTSCQVYFGAGRNSTRVEDARSDRAVAETAGEVRLLGGNVARTEFSSSSGGHTAGGLFPAVPDAGDAVAQNTYHRWTAAVPVTTVEARFPSVGGLTSVEVTRRNGLSGPHADGGRVLEVVIRGSAGSVTVTGAAFRSALGLRSDWFSVLDPVLRSRAVGIAANPAGSGYWVAAADGSIYRMGDAGSYGSPAGVSARPVVGMAPTHTGRGYWAVATDGGVFSYGDARFHGSTGAIRLNQPIVGMAATRSGRGYWMVASDGGIFAFGDAPFLGSMGGRRLNQPVVGMVATPSGRGYWLVARDGGIFAFGDAPFLGSTGAIRLNQPIVGLTRTRTGAGYWFVAADGGVFSYGDAVFRGSAGGDRLDSPVVGLAATSSGGGYRLLQADGGVLRYGDA
jgi:SpoIID/LytB domain protein